MGSLLSNGLIAIANNQSKESKDPTLTETMKSIKQSLDQNSLVNLEILKLLQSMKDNK